MDKKYFRFTHSGTKMTLMLSVTDGVLQCENNVCENKTNCRHLKLAISSNAILDKLKKEKYPVSITSINQIMREPN